MRHKVINVDCKETRDELVNLLNQGWKIVSALAIHCKGDGFYSTAPIQYVLRHEE